MHLGLSEQFVCSFRTNANLCQTSSILQSGPCRHTDQHPETAVSCEITPHSSTVIQRIMAHSHLRYFFRSQRENQNLADLVFFHRELAHKVNGICARVCKCIHACFRELKMQFLAPARKIPTSVKTPFGCIHTCGVFFPQEQKRRFFLASVKTLANSHTNAIDFVCEFSAEKLQINQVLIFTL